MGQKVYLINRLRHTVSHFLLTFQRNGIFTNISDCTKLDHYLVEPLEKVFLYSDI